jgi:hypothetical protein
MSTKLVLDVRTKRRSSRKPKNWKTAVRELKDNAILILDCCEHLTFRLFLFGSFLYAIYRLALVRR